MSCKIKTHTVQRALHNAVLIPETILVVVLISVYERIDNALHMPYGVNMFKGKMEGEP